MNAMVWNGNFGVLTGVCQLLDVLFYGNPVINYLRCCLYVISLIANSNSWSGFAMRCTMSRSTLIYDSNTSRIILNTLQLYMQYLIHYSIIQILHAILYSNVQMILRVIYRKSDVNWRRIQILQHHSGETRTGI
jgi:hypothetical protein